MRHSAANVEEWVLGWFAGRGTLPACSAESLRQLDYLQTGLIDSFGIVELILSVEEKFGITFAPEDFQDRRFATLGGLRDLIVRRSEEDNRAAA